MVTVTKTETVLCTVKYLLDFTFMWQCIVINFFLVTNQTH